MRLRRLVSGILPIFGGSVIGSMFVLPHLGLPPGPLSNIVDGFIVAAIAFPVLYWRFKKEGERREQALTCSETKARTLYESTSDAIMLLDEKGFFDCNEATVKIFGCRSKDEFCSKHPADLSPANQPCGTSSMELANRRIMTAMKDGTNRFEWMHRNLDTDANFPAEVLLTRMELDGRQVLQASVRDISERRRAEAKEREVAAFNKALIESIPFGVSIVDERGRILFMNSVMEAAAGSGALGDHCWERCKDDKRQCARCPLKEPITIGRTAQLQSTGVLGGRSMEVYHTGIMHQGRKALLEIFIDVTEREQAAEELKLSEEKFRQAQKMEAVGNLAGGVAHDFNNLLTSILSSAEFLRESLSAQDGRLDDVDEITGAGKRAALLTRQLLAFSRKQVLNPKVIELNDVVEDIHKLLRRTISEEVAIETRLASSLGRVKADEAQLGQVILNLAVNASDAMPGGGRLLIETADVDFSEDVVHRRFTIPAGSYVMFSITDSGRGIAPEIQQKIFEPFFTTKEVGKGTGLGLATVYGIVKQSGGYVTFYTEEGCGATFRVYLPATRERRAAFKESRLALESLRGSETILVVEDDAAVRKTSLRVLRNCGYHVLEAASGEDALAIVAGYREPIALLLTDVVMPGMDGADMARRVRNSLPEIKTVFTSGYPGEVISHRGNFITGKNFLSKPFSPSTLAALVREALDAPAPVSV